MPQSSKQFTDHIKKNYGGLKQFFDYGNIEQEQRCEAFEIIEPLKKCKAYLDYLYKMVDSTQPDNPMHTSVD